MTEIHKKENYKKEIVESTNEILFVYTRIVLDYLHFMEKSEKTKKIDCFQFILFRGLETMTHVFNYILFSTKNLGVSKSYAENSMFYYLEFISQITKDQHVFLQFTSRDAVIYVYKKTIYEIKKECIYEANEKTRNICDNVNKYTHKYFL